MKILSQPNFNNWTQTLTCGFCTAKLQITADDLKHRIDKRWYQDEWNDVTGGYYADVDLFFVTCPICTKEVQDHQTGNIPQLLQKQVKERCQTKENK